MPYFPQNDPAFNHLRHMVLMYGNTRQPWTAEEMKYSVAHINERGISDGWFFDSFLFLNVKAGSGRDLCADVNLGTTMAGEGDFVAVCSPQPANRSDWDELLEHYVGAEGVAATLNRAVETCYAGIGRRYTHARNVILMLPYPHITQQEFGTVRPGGWSLDFTTRKQSLAHATAQRLEACTWMVDEIVRRWQDNRWPHLHLLGVYWMFETVYRGWDVDDHWLLKELRTHIHSRGLKFLWIPYWSSYNVHLLDDYRSYYFDLAFLQPNYMFYRQGRSIARAAEAARLRGAGIEMEYYQELNEPIAVGNERHTRFREYLNGGVTHGYMTESACAYFLGMGSLSRMHGHADPQERAFYDDLHAFVEGRYRCVP